MNSISPYIYPKSVSACKKSHGLQLSDKILQFLSKNYREQFVEVPVDALSILLLMLFFELTYFLIKNK